MKAVRGVFLVVLALLTMAMQAHPADAEPDSPARTERVSVALVGFDALGMDQERVQRLETLFLKELERLTGKRVPSRRDLSKLSSRLKQCDGSNTCLAAIGQALAVEVVVSGNVAELGDSFVLNIKAVSTGTGEQLGKIESDPLRGQPDELIETIRVAAYRLLSPDELRGSISVLVDKAGAIVELNSKVIGTTPLEQPITGLRLGEHLLRVRAGEFGEFSSEVRVGFQKTTRVVVNLVDLRVKAEPDQALTNRTSGEPANSVRDAPKKWYQETWFLVSAGVGAAVIGGVVGHALAQPSVISCDEDPAQCMP